MSRTSVLRKLRCAVYTRKSSEEGLDQDFNSLQAQREACFAYIASQIGEGWQALPDHYDDGGFSGGTLERPALQRLLKEVAAKRVDIIVVYKVDRLTRSLSDFARIIDVLDGAGASFVSITQAFNTTSSMGRLTLNVLLSFAQFEREVTGERIRDKIAASKQKGLWMGGNLPLGYDADGRALKVNEVEAETVRQIFQRYLELGSVHLLRDELVERGVRSKQWITLAGKLVGGGTMNRGALYHLLRNRVYLGETRHREKSFQGKHAGIIEPRVFDEVQKLLAANGGKSRGVNRASQPSPLAGLVEDASGQHMTLVKAGNRRGREYRYYVSSAKTAGTRKLRIPASKLEDVALDRIRRYLGSGTTEVWPDARQWIERVVIRPSSVSLVLSEDFVERCDRNEIAKRQAEDSSDQLEFRGGELKVTIQASFKRHGRGLAAIGPGGEDAIETRDIDPALITALARAETWKRMLLRGKPLEEIAAEAELQVAYTRRVLRLAFLSPDIKMGIVMGKTLLGLTLQRIMERGVPDLWQDQRKHLTTPISVI